MSSLLFFGNCQVGAVARAVRTYIPGIDIQYIPNYEAIDIGSKKLHGDLEAAIMNCQSVVYQPMGAKWGAYAFLSEYLAELGKSSAVLPYIHVDGLWPAYKSGNRIVGIPEGLLNYCQRSLPAAQPNLAHCRQIILDLEKSSFNTDVYGLSSRLFLSLKTLTSIEKQNLTIPVTNYLHSHLRYHRLMQTQNHPTAQLTAYCLYKVFALLYKKNHLDRNLLNCAKDFYHSSADFPPDIFIRSPYPMTSHVSRVLSLSYHISDNETDASQELTAHMLYDRINALS